jgi:hypothetical protein
MEFSIYDNDKLILYGGFIFHGQHDGFGNGGAPTFSVCIDPDDKPGWQTLSPGKPAAVCVPITNARWKCAHGEWIYRVHSLSTPLSRAWPLL